MAKSLKATLAVLTLAALKSCEAATTPEERQASTVILVFAVIFLVAFLATLATSSIYAQSERSRTKALFGLLISCGCLVASLALWILYIRHRQTLESAHEQWQEDRTILLTLAITCTLTFIFASTCLLSHQQSHQQSLPSDSESGAATSPWMYMYGMVLFICVAATAALWVTYGGQEARTNCSTLRELSPALCEPSMWISPPPAGFSASECCRQPWSATTTVTTTMTQTSTRIQSKQTAPCQCNGGNASSVGALLCETGSGEECSQVNESCFAAGRLCTPALCRTRQGLSADCSSFLEEASCSLQAACVWEDTQVTYAYLCRPLESQDAVSVSLCAEYSTESTCNEQIICRWRLEALSAERCSNGGSWRGCVSSIPSLNHLCSSLRTSPDCATDRFCQWNPTCECTDDFFGDFCDKRVAPVTGGLGCVQHPSRFCRAIIYAASEDDRFRCSSPGLDGACDDWLHLKHVAQVMYEVELGTTIVDFAAVFFGLAISFSIHQRSNFQGYRRFTLLAIIISFVVDLVLKANLLSVVRAVSLSKYQDSSCTSQDLEGDDSIAIMATASIIVAALGLCATGVLIAAADLCDLTAKLGFLLITHGAGGLVAVVSFFSLRFNTEPFVDEIGAIEKAALGIQTLKTGQLCFTRHPDLPDPKMVGVEWSNPGLHIILPGALALTSLSSALAIAVVPRTAREEIREAAPAVGRRSRVTPAPVVGRRDDVSDSKPQPPKKPRTPAASAPTGHAPSLHSTQTEIP